MNTKLSAAQRAALKQKIGKNKARGNRTAPELEQKVIEEYTSNPDASYRTVAAKFHLAVGTVSRIMRRVGGVAALVGLVGLTMVDDVEPLGAAQPLGVGSCYEVQPICIQGHPACVCDVALNCYWACK